MYIAIYIKLTKTFVIVYMNHTHPLNKKKQSLWVINFYMKIVFNSNLKITKI